MKYVYKSGEARNFHKFGVNMTGYGEDVASANLILQQTKKGHFEEFYDEVSTHMWLILEGKGTFVIDDEPVEVEPKDLVVVPPNKRIHYFGTMKMVLCTTPAFKPENEHHVRDVSESESPYYSESNA